MSALEQTFRMIKAETQLALFVRLSALGFRPAVDHLRPAVPDEQAKRNILGGNAIRLFDLKLPAGKLAEVRIRGRRERGRI